MHVLDTNILIQAMNRTRPDFATRISGELLADRPLFVPTIVLYELEYGFARGSRRSSNQAILSALMNEGLRELAFERRDAEIAGDIRAALERSGTPIGPYDLLIAAQSVRLGATLVTLNRREFDRVPGILVTDWG